MEALPFLPQQFGEGCQQDQAVRRHLLKGASSESSTEGALGKRTFQRNGRIQVAKVSLTQLSAKKDKVIPTSAHSQVLVTSGKCS